VGLVLLEVLEGAYKDQVTGAGRVPVSQFVCIAYLYLYRVKRKMEATQVCFGGEARKAAEYQGQAAVWNDPQDVEADYGEGLLRGVGRR
jgi:hypothetical protein